MQTITGKPKNLIGKSEEGDDMGLWNTLPFLWRSRRPHTFIKLFTSPGLHAYMLRKKAKT
jgi:hypothetical protein